MMADAVVGVSMCPTAEALVSHARKCNFIFKNNMLGF